MAKTNTLPDSNIAAEERPIPSEAEGELETGTPAGNRPTPSQAEGDLETIEEDLKKH